MPNKLSQIERAQLIRLILSNVSIINPDLIGFTFQDESMFQKVRIRDNNLPEATQIGLINPLRRRDIITFNYKGFKERSQEEQAQLLDLNRKIETLVESLERHG